MTKPNIKIHLQEELLKRKTFSIPSVQRELRIKYGDLRECVSEMEKIGQVTLADDGLNYIVHNDPPAPKQTDNKSNSATKRRSSTDDMYALVEGVCEERFDGKLPFSEIDAHNRRGMLETLARLKTYCKDNDDDDDDNDDELDDEIDDEEDNEFDDEDYDELSSFLDEDEGEEDEEPQTQIDDCERIKQYVEEASRCAMVGDTTHYTKELLNSQGLVNILGREGYKLQLKAIQYGPSSTGYVFDYLSPKKDARDLNNFADQIKSVLNADDVTIVAPWSDTTIYILAKHNNVLDQLCKMALKFWVVYADGRASIATAQLGLGIGFYRAGKIMDQLQLLGCVEQSPLDEDVSKSVQVKLTRSEIDILFPEYLGWD